MKGKLGKRIRQQSALERLQIQRENVSKKKDKKNVKRLERIDSEIETLKRRI